MLHKERTLTQRLDRGPLRTMFVITSMPVGGAETLLVNLMRRLDRELVAPELCCLKEMGPLGEVAANEVTVHAGLIRTKYDHRILARMRKLLDERRIDAVVTVGAGDKMFWGRLAAWMEGVPVILSALHSTTRAKRRASAPRWTTPAAAPSGMARNSATMRATWRSPCRRRRHPQDRNFMWMLLRAQRSRRVAWTISCATGWVKTASVPTWPA